MGESSVLLKEAVEEEIQAPVKAMAPEPKDDLAVSETDKTDEGTKGDGWGEEPDVSATTAPSGDAWDNSGNSHGDHQVLLLDVAALTADSRGDRPGRTSEDGLEGK